MQHQVARVSPALPDVLRCIDQHSPRAGRRVADPHSLFRLQQLDDQPYHRPGRVELTALLPGVVRELVDQVLVGVSQHVRAGAAGSGPQVLVAQVQLAEVVQQAPDDPLPVSRAAQPRLVVPVRAGQHPVQTGCIRLFDRVTRHVDRLAQVHRRRRDCRPARRLRHEELVLVPVPQRDLARHPRPNRVIHLLLEPV